MPRTFKATIALIAVLGIVLILSVIVIFQSNKTNREVIQLRQEMTEVTRAMSRIQSQLERGVAVAGGAAGGGASADRYASALNDPDNILVAPTDQLHHPDAVEGGTLRRRIASDPAGFNWVTENSADVRDVQYYVHNSFARPDFNDPDNYVPELAYKITVNDDWTEYVVHLREGVYWQTPNVDFSDPRYEWLRERRELTAEDAVFYYEMLLHPEVEAAHAANYVQDIESLEVVDRYTFKVTWKRPVYHSRSTVLGGYPMPKWLFSRDRDGEEFPEETIPGSFNNHWSLDTPIGTGPYRFNRYEQSSRIVLEVNEDYWGQRPAIDRIEFQITRDDDAAFARILSGETDFMPGLSETLYRTEIMEGGPNSPFNNGTLEHETIDAFAYYYIGWNGDSPIFEDKMVRRAMTHAFNRQGIIDNVLYGLAELQTGPYYYKHPGTKADIEAWPYDLEEAARMLDEAGWVDTTGDGIRNKTINGEVVPFRFSLVAYNRPVVRSWTSIFREDLRQIGVDMRNEYVDWPLMQRRMEEKNFDAFTGGWGLSWEVDLYQIWHSSQADIPRGSNRVGFRNEEADELIERLRETFDPDERLEILHRFHEIVHEEQPYSFFYAPQQVPVWNPNLQNVVFQTIRPQTFSLPWYFEAGGN